MLALIEEGAYADDCSPASESMMHDLIFTYKCLLVACAEHKSTAEAARSINIEKASPREVSCFLVTLRFSNV